MRKFHHRVHFRPFRRSCDILTRVPGRAPKALEVLPEAVEAAGDDLAVLLRPGPTPAVALATSPWARCGRRADQECPPVRGLAAAGEAGAHDGVTYLTAGLLGRSAGGHAWKDAPGVVKANVR